MTQQKYIPPIRIDDELYHEIKVMLAKRDSTFTDIGRELWQRWLAAEKVKESASAEER